MKPTNWQENNKLEHPLNWLLEMRKMYAKEVVEYAKGRTI